LADLTFFVTAYAVLVGLLLGSFINMAADRVPRSESLISPRSHCRACGRTLNLIDLLPVLGYLLRGGRCATCRTPIGASAPAIEGVSGALVLASIVWLGLWPGALVGSILMALWGLGIVALAVRRRSLDRSAG